jgi:hypothetical protein
VTNTASAARKLHGDQRGAIMLMGLCMSCFLIGSLWFLVGIGDAIVFRDSMQEIADHAAFTSAVLHAKGMNFISACNLIMLAFVFFHILLGIVNDILFLACLIPVINVVACPLFVNANNIYRNYGNNVMKKAVTALHYGEVVAAYGYPWLGAIKGYTLGTDYGKAGVKKRDMKVLVLSPSMLPGTVMDAAINKLFKNQPKLQRSTSALGSAAGQKKGLPVEAKPNNELCAKIAKESVDTLLGFLKDVRFINRVFGLIKDTLARGVKFRYCNSLGFAGNTTDLTAAGRPDIPGQLEKANDAIDKANEKIENDNRNAPQGSKPKDPIGKVNTDTGGTGLAVLDPGLDQWWGKEGPLFPMAATANGSPWNEVWAMNINPDYTDNQEHRVALGKRTYGQKQTANAAFGYFAEAEFYFDCKKKWGDEECNGDDNAAFSIQWRARLRRLEFPAVGSLIGSYIGQWVAHLSVLGNAVKELRYTLQGLPIGKLTKLVNPIVNFAFDKLKQQIKDLGTKVGGAANPGLDGSYH